MRLYRYCVAIAGALLFALTPLRATAGPTLLFNPDNGRIFYAEQLDDQWHPASLTKIMTAYLVFEALRSGQVTIEAKIPVSENANAKPPSKIGLPVGAEMPMELAIKALIVKSANDVAVMLAEAIAGSEEAFVARMNERARELGMTRTHFVNPNGLPEPAQVTTARDLAKLSAAVVKKFPEFAHYWQMSRMKIGKIRLRSYNNLLRTFEGTNGLKTGFICDSGFNIVASAQRGGRRLMAVVLGESTAKDRGRRAEALLQHGFDTFVWKSAFAASSIATAPLSQTAKSVRSIREKVKARSCRRRRPRKKPAAKVSNKPQHASQKTLAGGRVVLKQRKKAVARKRKPRKKKARVRRATKKSVTRRQPSKKKKK